MLAAEKSPCVPIGICMLQFPANSIAVAVALLRKKADLTFETGRAVNEHLSKSLTLR